MGTKNSSDNPRQVVEKALGLTSRIVGTELTIEEKKLVEDIFKYPSILRQHIVK